ncbi:hypothetical protein PFTANZ_06432, partial [Plasmodium falciparum Tanzania (2000708)]
KCINKNPNETCTEDTSHDIDDHFEDDEDDELPSAPNPCSGDPSGSSTTHRSMVKTVAREMHRKAHQEAKGRELSKLRADATKGKYTKKNGKASKFNDICDITLQHSNRNTGHSSEPCQGKDKKGEMFQLQNGWKTGRKIDMTDEYAYMPPRRQHMCTSNLENLQTKCGPLKGEDGANVNDSFLGHILLSANKEAEWLKNKYKKQPGYGDDATICRAMKYSFADLGDIIRGRDLWDKENGMKHLQDHLIDVFKNIKEKLPGIKVNDKYPQDENKTPPYKKLREDWWEANRKEVWRAMTCATTSGKIPCSIVTPLDDYIPQRLRWMTEWAESFCKMQSQEYEKLEEKCSQCRTDGIKKCTNKTSECDKCTPACKAYREKIKEWEKQWNKMYMKYTLLYLPAQRNFAGYVFRDDSPDYKQMLDFLQQLLPPKSGTNNPKTPYSSAAGYIHQEVPHMQCKGQTRFCEETHPEYAFKDPPKEYATACTCKDRDEPPPPPPPPPTVVDVCTTVATALAEDNLNEACRQKYEYGREKFPNWKCIPTSDGSSNPTSDKGAICVPPRRRKLYVGELTKWAKTSGNTQGGGDKATQASQGEKSPQGTTPASTSSPSNPRDGDLVKAFVESAAVETFFLWHKYKMENTKDKTSQGGLPAGSLPLPTLSGGIDSPSGTLDSNDPNNIYSGKIPPPFLRQMFYTLADYRDLCVGEKTMIKALEASGDKNIDTINKKIKTILNGDTTPRTPVPQNSDKNPKDWWQKYGEDIWDGMICALSYDTEKKKMDPIVRKKLMDDDNKNTIYNYDNVTFKGGLTVNTKLTEFVTRPTFFRWLEEWGEEFCRKKKIKIGKIIYECRSDNPGHQYCSGDGYDCERKDINRNEINANLDCPRCGEQCIKYTKWLKNKRNEFEKQKSEYKEEHEKLKKISNNHHYKKFYEKIEKYSSVDDFLESLYHCKDVQDNKDKKNEINFKNLESTFGSLEYCKACPVYGVDCNTNRGCIPISHKDKNAAEGEPTVINILINDSAIKDVDEQLKPCSDKYSFFKALKQQKWECQKKYGVNQCNLKNVADNIDIDKYIVFNEFFQRWLRYFVQDYNKLKHKINPCIKKENGTEDKCITACKKNCECVGKWLEIKGNEWEKIKEHYGKDSKISENIIAYTIKSYFDELYFDNEADKAKKVVEGQNEQKKLWGCTGDNIKYGEEAQCKNGNFITNLIDKLKIKIATCKTQHDEKKGPCDPFPPVEDSPPEDTSPEDAQKPAFCPEEKVEPPEKPEAPKPEPEPEVVPKKPEEELPEQQIPINCIDKAAYELQKEVTINIGKHSNILKGNETGIPLTDCKEVNDVVVDNGVDPKKIDKDKLEKIFPSSIYSCESEGINNVHIKKEWDCNNRNINFREKHLCLPPRRQFMCMKNIKDMQSENIKDKNELLKEVIKTAKSEGVRILKNYQEQNKSFFSEVCDDMKYSFADLGDIIKGRDLWKKYPNYHRTEGRLQSIFKNIHNKMTEGDAKEKYKYDYPYYHNLRNDWWNENRESIWKAMTFSAPKDAYINKTTKSSKNNISSTNMYNYCGHNEIPPYDDYIPQRLRWMKEWGEYVCKILNEKVNNMENDCDKCKLNYKKCSDNDDGNKCKSCKEKCKQYTKLIYNLKSQFSVLEKKYNELYTKAKNNSGGFVKDNDKYVIEFLEKVIKEKLCDVESPHKYLDKASHCMNYNFIGNEIKTTPYTFNDHPENYKNQCVCTITNHPLDKCPFRHENKALCNILKEFSKCKNKTFDNKLDSWGTHDLKLRTSINQGVFIPPRRTYLCLKPLIKKKYAQHEEHIFLNDLLTATYTEAYMLGNKFKDQPTEALQAIKWSFADYGDIIKGTDMIDNMYLNDMKTQLETILKYNGTSNNTMSFKDWWEYNKDKVWHVMLCGYNKAGGTINYFDCNIPSEVNTDQFLRWFQEWTEAFCSRRNELYEELKGQCDKGECLDGRIYPDGCKNACEKYRNFMANKKIQYDLQMYQYNKKYNNSQINSKKKPDFIDKKCNGKCDCLFGKFIENSKLDNPYETLNNDELKEKCDCQKSERTPHLPLPADEPFDPTILQTTIPFGVALALGSIAFLFLK